MFKLTSLNLNGIRSAASKGLEAWIDASQPDCMGVQELKAQHADLSNGFEVLAGLRGYFHCAQKKGYSGVGVYSKHEPTAVIAGFGADEFDAEGRCLELRFDSPSRRLSVISAYFPSGSSGEDRQAAKFRFLDVFWPHFMRLKAQRELLLVGDLNIAHQPIDLKNWKGNQKNSGFLPEERAWMTRVLTDGGLVDVYRHLHPTESEGAYTWWSNRGAAYAKNVGWRIDYHLATPGLAQHARIAQVFKAQRFSDHAPLTVEYAFAL